MTTAISNTTLTLANILDRVGADGRLLPHVRTLMQTNEMLGYALAWNAWVRANNNLTFKGSRDATEPEPSEIDYDEGVTADVGSAEPYEEPTCTLAKWLKIDWNKLNDQPDPEALLNQEKTKFYNGFNKKFSSRLWYGDRNTYRKRIRGFTYRSAYSSLSSARVYDCAGGNASATANKMSIFVLRLGPGHIQFTYPQNDTRGQTQGRKTGDTTGIGLYIKDYGASVPLSDGTNNYPGCQIWMQQRWGLVVHNPDSARRLCNVSSTNIDEVDDFSFNEDYLIDALVDLKKNTGSWENCLIVVPSLITGQIWKRVKDKANLWHTMKDPFGRMVNAFSGIPIAVDDGLLTTEATVVA